MGNVTMEARDINYRGGETKMSVEDALKSTSGEAAAIAALQEAVGNLQTDTGNLQTTKANLITIAPVFSAETAYDPGDLVYYNGLTYRCVNSHEGEWDADDFAATTISGELATLKSGLTDVNNMRIVRDLIDNGSGAVSITFSGSGHTRCANMLLICAKQSAVYPPIPIMFTGVQGSNQSITSVIVADNGLNVTASGLTITIPSDLSGWGYHMLVKLYPNDNIAVSVT